MSLIDFKNRSIELLCISRDAKEDGVCEGSKTTVFAHMHVCVVYIHVCNTPTG